MLKELLKDEYKLINELNNSCTKEELQEIQATFKRLICFKINDENKLQYKNLHSAITSNNLECYTSYYYDAYKLQEILEEYKDDSFIDYACASIVLRLSCDNKLHDNLLSFFDNLIINEDFTELYKDYLIINQDKTEEEADKIIEELGL